MTRPLNAMRLTLVASGLVLAASGCHKNDGAGSADPHHYTAAEAREAFLAHNRGSGPAAAGAPQRPGAAAGPAASAPGN